MNRKISIGMAVTIVILAMTVTFSITMLVAMRLFDSTVSSVKEKESMYNKIAEVDRYVRSNDYYTIDENTLYDRLTRDFAEQGAHSAQGALAKLEEEVSELRRAVENGGDVPDELGDVLFAAVKVGRFCGVDPETAVNGTCEKFIRRFSAVEAAVTAQGQDMKDVDVSQLMVYWNRAKHPAKDEIEETEEEKGQST